MTGEPQMMKAFIAISLALGAAGASAQQTVNMPIVIELSGAGAVSGTNFRDGAVLAIEEINAKGGILRRKINAPQSDTQSNAGISRAQVQKAIDAEPYVILGPVFSGSVKVNMILAQQAEVPQIVGAEAADITQMGNAYIFRTSFGQQMSMPKIANYIRDGLKAKTVSVLWVNNDFGKGGRGHVGLSADAPVPAVLAFKEKFNKRFGYVPDHNGIKGYTGVYAVKHATEKIGKFDRKLLAKTLHGLTITPAQEPGILMETTWDQHGDIDRISFLAEVVAGKQKIVQTLPKLGK